MNQRVGNPRGLTPYVENVTSVKLADYGYHDSRIPLRTLPYLFDNSSVQYNGWPPRSIFNSSLSGTHMNLQGDSQTNFIPSGSIAFGDTWKFI